MSKRLKSTSEKSTCLGMGNSGEEVPETETRTTRSGRKVRTPAALLDSEAPPRTPTRRTRRSVVQEQTVVEESNTDVTAQTLQKPLPEETEPQAEAADAAHVSGPAAAETAPSSGESLPETLPGTLPESPPKKKPRQGPSGTQNPVIPLGKPKSGRVWKNRNKQRFSALVRDKQLCSSWEKKMEAKREKELVKKYSLHLKDEAARQKEEKRKRREENLKRRAENERKAEIVQVIKNTTKIKRMKKKQLRKIEKRDTLALLQKSQKQNVKAKGHKSNKVVQELT